MVSKLMKKRLLRRQNYNSKCLKDVTPKVIEEKKEEKADEGNSGNSLVSHKLFSSQKTNKIRRSRNYEKLRYLRSKQSHSLLSNKNGGSQDNTDGQSKKVTFIEHLQIDLKPDSLHANQKSERGESDSCHTPLSLHEHELKDRLSAEGKQDAASMENESFLVSQPDKDLMFAGSVSGVGNTKQHKNVAKPGRSKFLFPRKVRFPDRRLRNRRLHDKRRYLSKKKGKTKLPSSEFHKGMHVFDGKSVKRGPKFNLKRPVRKKSKGGLGKKIKVTAGVVRQKFKRISHTLIVGPKGQAVKANPTYIRTRKRSVLDGKTETPSVRSDRRSDSQSPVPRKRKRFSDGKLKVRSVRSGRKPKSHNFRSLKRKRSVSDRIKTDGGGRILNPTFKKLKVFSGKKLRRNVFSLFRDTEPKLVDNLAHSCSGPSPVNRVLAKSLVKWCLVARKSLVRKFRKEHDRIRSTKCRRPLLIAERCRTWDESYEAIVGPSKHSSSTESYFYDTAYEPVSSAPFPLVSEGTSGKIMNVFPHLEQLQKSFRWKCGPMCKIDKKKIFRSVKKLYKVLSRTISENHMVYFLRNMNKCSGTCANSSKRGHTLGCRINNGNAAPLVVLQNLMPHYPQLRSLVGALQNLKRTLHDIDALDFALLEGDLETLQTVAEQAKLAGGEFQADNDETFVDEEDIVKKHFDGFVAFEMEMRQVPRNYCFSCEKLLARKSLVEVNKMRCKPVKDKWNEIILVKKRQGVSVEFICQFCLTKLRKDQLPSVATLNKMEVPTVPPVIQKLTSYERMFIQRAKVFQTVTKMGTVSGKNIPSSNLVPKVIGRSFYLPLPMEQTLEKILKPHQAIMPNQEAYFLLRSLPTKQKKIWESLISVTNVLEALKWLKKNNSLYAEIELPHSAQELLNLLEDIEELDLHQPLKDLIINGSDDDPDDPDEPGGALDDGQIHGVNNGANDQQKDLPPILHHENMAAMLTQRERDDAFYQKFTIFPVYDKRQNKLASEMYQMIRIEAEKTLDSRTEKLDALCFPDLYPYGNNCFCESRQVELQFFDFVRAKLLSRHPQFRLNIQYLFFLLNEANMKQLSAGVYQVLNITRVKLTAAEFLEKLAVGDFDRDMTSIFSRVRNTEAFWKTPRNQIRCMIDHYGSPTWFVTHSPADYADPELDRYLRDVLGEAAKGKSTSALVAMDPVSVARFLDRRLYALLAFWKADAEILGEIDHYVWRREYQGRGTQHFHILLWIKNAPILGKSSAEEVIAFILKHLTCSIPDKNKFPELYRKVMSYQVHRDNSYCLRSKKVRSGKRVKRCRFSFPRPITNKNFVLRDAHTAIAGRRNLKPDTRLYDLPRKANEVWINDYNAPTLAVVEGNVDVQFIGESSAALGMYITKYQTKAEKSHMDDIFNDINSTRSVNSRLWNIGLRGLMNRECGALEAADTLMSIPLWGTDSRTSFRWLDVHMFRSRKLKSKQQIQNLNPTDTDLFCPNIIDVHYPNRPKELEDACLYDYFKDYDIIKEEPQREETVYYPYPDFGFVRKRTFPHLINHYHFDPKQRPEQYFYSLLLMFKPWRRIEDLMGIHANYADAFDSEKEVLQDAFAYHEKFSEIRAAKEAVSKMIEEKSKQMQGEGEKKEEDMDDDEEEFLQCKVTEADNAMQEFRAAANEDVADLPSLIAQLNEDQLRVFENVKSVIQSEKPLRQFVSGVGGTGKSFLIRVVTLWVKQELKKDVAITAPTGIAAFNINGFTIHRILQLPVEHNKSSKYTQLTDHVLSVIRAEMKNVILLIIDEISMVSCLMLRMIHERLTEIFDSSNTSEGYFGNINILLFGDLLQLPPVSSSPPFLPLTDSECTKHFGSVSKLNLWREFTYDELQINMRQKSDRSFCELLANIRLGFCSEKNLETLTSRQFLLKSSTPEGRLTELAEHNLKDERESVCILPTNKMCRKLNEEVLRLLKTDIILLEAEDEFSGGTKSVARRKAAEKKLVKLEEDCSRTAGLEKLITVKEGARIMLKRNIDVTKGYVNGATGTVLSVKFGPDKTKLPVSLSLKMKTDILELEPVETKFEILPGIFVYRKQFPISVAYGITVHKSQGLSLDACMIDIGNRVFIAGQSYVALSRVKTLEGLQIINIDPQKIKADTRALKEYSRLRSKVPHLKSVTEKAVKRARNQSIQDVVWAIVDNNPVNYLEQKTAPTPTKSKLPYLPALENKDNASCFANASLQCLLSYEPLRAALRRSVRDSALKSIAKNFSVKTNKTFSAMDVRREASARFTETTQKDAYEFLNIMINGNETLQAKIQFTEVQERKCSSCNAESEIRMSSYVLQLPTCQSDKKITKLLENLSAWTLNEDSICQNCDSGKCLQRNIVVETSDLLIIQLLLWKTLKGQKVKATSLQLNALPTTTINVSGRGFKLHSVLFHDGPVTSSGHYTAIVRSGKDYILADDDAISECRWPRGSKNAYLLFYVKSSDSKAKRCQQKPLEERSPLCTELPPSKAKLAQMVKNTKARSITKELPKAQVIARPRRKVKQDEKQTVLEEPMRDKVKSSTLRKSQMLPLPPFKNDDNVSCYANASLQCLLSYEPLRAAISCSAGNSAFKKIAQRFRRARIPLSSSDVRSEVSAMFAERRQQDAPEFINALIRKNALLQERVEFNELSKVKCDDCGHETERLTISSILQLPVERSETQITKMFTNYSSWSLIEGARCEICHGGNKRKCTLIKNTGEMLIIQFLLFEWKNEQSEKITDFRLDDLPSAHLTVDGDLFELHAAIFHHGLVSESGHYTAVVRLGDKFNLADDTQINEHHWPAGSENAYLLFYRKVDREND